MAQNHLTVRKYRLCLNVGQAAALNAELGMALRKKREWMAACANHVPEEELALTRRTIEQGDELLALLHKAAAELHLMDWSKGP